MTWFSMHSDGTYVDDEMSDQQMQIAHHRLIFAEFWAEQMMEAIFYHPNKGVTIHPWFPLQLRVIMNFECHAAVMEQFASWGSKPNKPRFAKQ